MNARILQHVFSALKGCYLALSSFRNVRKNLEQQLTLVLTLPCSLTHIVGPAVPGLVLVGESGIEGGSAIVLQFGFNVLSHFHLCQENVISEHSRMKDEKVFLS